MVIVIIILEIVAVLSESQATKSNYQAGPLAEWGGFTCLGEGERLGRGINYCIAVVSQI